MEIVAYNFKPYKARKNMKSPVMIVRMNREEAIKTIESLAFRLDTKDCNTGRFEKHDKNGVDFSIAVHENFV